MAQTGFAEKDWKSLYRIGGLSALICAAMYLLASAVYIPANLAGPPPGNCARMVHIVSGPCA